MSKFRKKDIVVRNSYNKDVLFEIKQIISIKNNKNIYILKGITKRIEADSPEEDLEKVDKRIMLAEMRKFEDKLTNRIKKYLKESRGNIINYTGKILHIDGDKRYSEKSFKYYKSLSLNAVVKNIPENKQSLLIINFLEMYRPDVLIITRA